MSKNVRDNNDIEGGMGYRWDDDENSGSTHFGATLNAQNTDTMPGIAPNKYRIVSFKIMSGLLNQPKLINIKFCPLIIEMELVGNYNDPLVTPQIPATTDPANSFSTAHIGNVFEIIDAQLKLDCLLLDSQLNESYISHLLSGKSLPLTYSTWITQQSSITNNKLAIQVARSCSRLKKCYITFFNPAPTPGVFDKQAITFYHPMSQSGRNVATNKVIFDPGYNLQFQIQLGSTLYPEYPVRSISEAFKILRQTLNLPEYHQHSLSVNFNDYISDHFICAQNSERVQDSDWTGINTKSGQLLIIKV